MTVWSSSLKSAKVAIRGGGVLPRIATAIAPTAGPERRTTPMPPRPGGVAMATMVSRRTTDGATPVRSSRPPSFSPRVECDG